MIHSKSWMVHCSAIFVVVSLWLCGCKTVHSGDLPGTWVMRGRSREVLPAELQKASAKLVLDANGTFVATEMPGLFYFPGRRDALLESGSGVWKLVSREGKQQLQLDFMQIKGWQEALPFSAQLDVAPGGLFYFLGDADEGRRVDFERR